MNEINEVINLEKASCRNFDANELMQLLKSKGFAVFASWGASQFTVNDKNDTTMFKMKVNGNHHKGYVYIFLSFLDLFNVYLTKFDDTIVNKIDGLYFDQLVNWIDEKIEWIDAYKS